MSLTIGTLIGPYEITSPFSECVSPPCLHVASGRTVGKPEECHRRKVSTGRTKRKLPILDDFRTLSIRMFRWIAELLSAEDSP